MKGLKSFRKILAVAAASAMVIGITSSACMAQDEADAEVLKGGGSNIVYVITPSVSNPAFKTEADAAETKAKELGYEVKTASHDDDPTKQTELFDSTMRETDADLKAGAKLEISEKLMTHGEQTAQTQFSVDLNGEGSSANVVSRSVARDDSAQLFRAKIAGNNACAGHSECDAIIMDNAKVRAIPELEANDLDAELIHEAAIGKIAGEQLIKLMTLGLSEEEAEEMIISGFLK